MTLPLKDQVCKGCNYEKEFNEPWHEHDCGKVMTPLPQEGWGSRFSKSFPKKESVNLPGNRSKILDFIRTEILAAEERGRGQGMTAEAIKCDEHCRKAVENLKKEIMRRVNSAGGIGGLRHLEEIIDSAVKADEK